eukprot:COSAG06_NODE_9801_length_1813_cov_3.014002_1_plen_35_part_10
MSPTEPLVGPEVTLVLEWCGSHKPSPHAACSASGP